MLNTQPATGYLHRNTGKRIDAPLHTYFFVRMELWALIISALIVLLSFNDMRTNVAEASFMENPAVGDIYIVNPVRDEIGKRLGFFRTLTCLLRCPRPAVCDFVAGFLYVVDTQPVIACEYRF